ncbi:MAG: nuclear transport factor 2 family protein [Clostridia bacterium]|nr:nuclear transport factor 2 family protein [Clostridia bacterium]
MEDHAGDSRPDNGSAGLTRESILELWSKTYNTDGKPDWSHLFPHYHPDIVFQDSIQRIEGIDAFKEMCGRLTDRCRSLYMEIQSLAQDGPVFLMAWKMTMSFRKYPDTPVYGASRLTLHPDGRIVEQRDYFDLWGDIFNGIPKFKPVYRRFMKKKFG